MGVGIDIVLLLGRKSGLGLGLGDRLFGRKWSIGLTDKIISQNKIEAFLLDYAPILFLSVRLHCFLCVRLHYVNLRLSDGGSCGPSQVLK